MTTEGLLAIFAGATTLAFLLQAVSIWRAHRAVTDLVARLEKRVAVLQAQAGRVMEQINDLADGLEPLTQLSHDMQERVSVLQERFDRRARDVDELVGELLVVGRNQARRVDEVVSDTVDKFDQTTSAIQEDILKPVIEISSFVKGLRTGFDYLFARRRTKPVTESYPEEEMFI